MLSTTLPCTSWTRQRNTITTGRTSFPTSLWGAVLIISPFVTNKPSERRYYQGLGPIDLQSKSAPQIFWHLPLPYTDCSIDRAYCIDCRARVETICSYRRNLYDYENNEYKPYRANEYSMTRLIVRHGQHGCTRSKNGSRYGAWWSGLISGVSSLSNSLWVGMWVLIVWWLQGMEHLNYACHP